MVNVNIFIILTGLVQDQEVQLKCDYIRIGSLRCRSNDTVRVRNDGPNSGIYFKFLSESFFLNCQQSYCQSEPQWVDVRNVPNSAQLEFSISEGFTNKYKGKPLL